MTSISDQSRFYSTFTPAGTLVYDIGAHLGNRIDAFLACGACVIAVEPQPDCAAHLRTTFLGNPRVTVIEGAVGSMRGTLNMRRARDRDPIATFSQDFIAKTSERGRFGPTRVWSVSFPAKVQTLDELVDIHGAPSFIKIDVEGFEPQVLSGLTKAVPALSFEWTPELLQNADECMCKCEDLGLRYFNISFMEGMRLCFRSAVSRERMKSLLSELSDDPFLFGDVFAARLPIVR